MPWWLAHSTPAVKSVSRLSITIGSSVATLNAKAAPHGCLPVRL